MLQAFAEVLTIRTLLGVVGAVPGALRAAALSRSRGMGWTRATSDALIGVVLAASVAELMTPPSQPSAALLVGLLAGLLGGRALDSLFEMVPEVVRVLALGWASKYGGGGTLRRQSGWGDLPRFTRPDEEE